MNSKKPLFIGTLALVLVIGGAALLYKNFDGSPTAPITAASKSDSNGASAGSDDDPSSQSESDPEPAPDFTVLDRDGNEVKLSDLRGKPVIISFWASWCGVCKTGMPDFEEAFAEYGDDVHFMMINLTAGSETRTVAESYIAENGYSFPIYFDTELSAAGAYGVNAVPVTYLVDAEGNLVAYGQGRLGLEGIKQGIDMASGSSQAKS